MSRYNHFSKETYAPICFGSLNNGDKFRMDKFKGNRRRKDIIMIKLSDLSYKELKSGKEYKLYHSAFDVQSFDQLNQTKP
jgi:hypothetical protein